MVNWKGAAVLVVLVAVFAVYLFQTRPPAKTGSPGGRVFFGCRAGEALALSISREDGKSLELQRSSTTSGWSVASPPGGRAADAAVDAFITGLRTLSPSDTLNKPAPDVDYGLTKPHLEVVCRVGANVSFNLSVGKQSFDGSSRYARLGGDARVYVLSGTEVDRLDQFLDQPPFRPSPIPSGPSPSPTT